MIVDDHDVARLGLSELLEGDGHSVVASVCDGRAAMAALESDATIEVILLDVRMPREDGLDVLETIRSYNATIPIIMFSANDNPTYVARSAALGANEFLLKFDLPGSICDTIKTLTEGGSLTKHSRIEGIRRLLQEEITVDQLPAELPLTTREAQVLRHVAFGLSNKEVARSLSISVETVKEHVQNILRKINATDRTDAAVRAVRLGLTEV